MQFCLKGGKGSILGLLRVNNLPGNLSVSFMAWDIPSSELGYQYSMRHKFDSNLGSAVPGFPL